MQLYADTLLNLRRKLDNDMFNHVSYVANRCLLLLKHEGTNRETLIKCGKYLWRLIRVVQTYNHKKRDASLQEVLDIVVEFKGVFDGI